MVDTLKVATPLSDTLILAQPSRHRTQANSLRARYEQLRKTPLKKFHTLIVLSGLLSIPIAHAQSSTILIGLREVYWRYAVDSSGAAGFSFIPHCQRAGLMEVENLNPFRYSFSSLETDSISSTSRWLGSTGAMRPRQELSGVDRAKFWIPPEWCKKSEVWS